MGLRRRWIDRLDRQQIVVHLTEGSSLRGILADAWSDGLVLTSAYALTNEGAVSLDGRVIVPRDRVAFVQHIEQQREELSP